MNRIHKRKARGFTLIEILVVGALLALFAALAIVNIQEMFSNNVRKAAIGEVHSLGTALSMAHNDISLFPKFNYLTLPPSLIIRSDGEVRADFDYMGFFTPVRNIDAPSSLARLWKGGYFAMSPSRRGIRQGAGGVVTVRLPSGGQGQDSVADSLVDWPADPWGNPYVLYLLKVHRPAVSDGTPGWRFIESPTEPADFMIAVVSYGQNGVPGTTWEKASSGAAYGAPGGRSLRTATPQQRDARLFLDGDSLGGPAQFTMLRPQGYDFSQAPLRTRILQGPRQAADVAAWEADFPPPNNNTQDLEIRGILDIGSDDIVFIF